MNGDIDNTAEALDSVRSNGNLDTVEIVDVTEASHEVCFHFQLAGGANLEERFTRPPVWGANCDLKRVLDAHSLGPDEIDQMVGEQVPVNREVIDGTLHFEIDIETISADT